MCDVSNVGYILVELIDVLKFMMDNPLHDRDSLVFGIRLLQYVNYLCREQGIDFDVPIYYDAYFSYLMDLEQKAFLESVE